MSFFGAQFTPSGGTAILLGGITDASPDSDAAGVHIKGDLDVFARVIATPTHTRTITITCQDVAKAGTIPTGVAGTLVISLGDSVNKGVALGGGLLYTYTGAVCTKNNSKGGHGATADGSLTFECQAPDGQTDPLIVTTL